MYKKILLIAFVFLICISLASAVEYSILKQTLTTDSGWSSNSQTAKYGMRFTANESYTHIYIYNVTNYKYPNYFFCLPYPACFSR